MSRPPRLLGTLAVLILGLAACGGVGGGVDAAADREHRPPDIADWDAVRAEAEGQTVSWWMFGGDERINRYVDEHVVPAVAERGVELRRVPIDDTADAVQRVLAERQAGVDDGAVDLIWINGENFAAGKEAGLWLEDWADELPNAALVDPDTVELDFGVEVDGQESPWSRAAFVIGYDEARTPEPPRTFDDLLAYARDNPGRVTYPAPPDFTGAAFVRRAVTELGEDEAFELLGELREHQWRGGDTFPGSEAELNTLFGDGEVDLTFSYDPNVVQTGVRTGQLPETARPTTFATGTLHNVSYVTIPAIAEHLAGALVVADLLLEPELQALKADPELLGVPTVLDPERLDDDERDRLERATAGPYLLDDLGELLDELPAERVDEINDRWRREVLGE
jgi:putative spermidine/putrescine transport system substrate-binding protein